MMTNTAVSMMTTTKWPHWDGCLHPVPYQRGDGLSLQSFRRDSQLGTAAIVTFIISCIQRSIRGETLQPALHS